MNWTANKEAEMLPVSNSDADEIYAAAELFCAEKYIKNMIIKACSILPVAAGGCRMG